MGGFAGIASQFPALAIKPPESPIQELSGVLAIKGQQQQQQMGQVELDNARQIQNENATIMRLYAENKGDMNQTLADARNSGQVRPQTLLDLQAKTVAAQVQAAQLTTDQLNNHAKMAEMAANELDSIKNLPPEQQVQGIRDSVGRLLQAGGPDTAKWLIPIAQDLAQNPTPANFTKHETALMGERWVNQNEISSRDLAAKPTVAQAQAMTAANLDKAQTEAKTAQLAYLSTPTPEEARTTRLANLLKTQADTAKANADTVRDKAETAVIGSKPVFAFDPASGQRVLTTRPQAQAQGLTNPVDVSEADINKETAVNRQLNDVQMNVSRYRGALNRITTDVSTSDQARIANILGSAEATNFLENYIPGTAGGAAQVQALQKNANWNKLSPELQDATIGALRAKGSVIAFQKALTETGRTSKEALEIEMSNLPTPGEGSTVANKQMDAFQENIDAASKGLTKVPWLPTPAETRQAVEQKDSHDHPGQQIRTFPRQFGGVTVGGRDYSGRLVTGVNPDGSYQAQP